ncbi:MAG: malto-oligosyltrehalose trehalohydrolase [Bryobacteraceae bacterium]|nr:malto-oligosyltrehalose trehalohydrolase [Bryobacteraceae bacterium]
MVNNAAQLPRRIPVGAELSPQGTAFRVWAPKHNEVDVVCADRKHPLTPEGDGYFSATIAAIHERDTYWYSLKGERSPDPASRFQPEGPHGPSQVVDPSSFRWTDAGWSGVPMNLAVIYELHVGTFTQEGTWSAASERLTHLVELGVTVVEVMPVAEFTGRYGWGYDGVGLYAPTRLYGTPDDMRAFVDKAHRLGLAVILDVVYNHLGADGNYLGKYSDHYFTQKHKTDWGDAINFDGPNNIPVREFFIANAGFWIDEFHLDGLRLDATQNIYDDSEPHVLKEITAAVRGKAQNRITLVVAENEPQDTQLVRPLMSKHGFGMDGLWNDDLHHSASVAMTGHNEAYYTDYLGNSQEFISALKYGYLYQGQWYKWQKQRRGTPAWGLQPAAFITFIENHDQVANSARGRRMHQETTPGLIKAMTTLILLGPGTPMLFQGQEFASSRSFKYFADVPSNLVELVREGRKEFMQQWKTIGMPEMQQCLGDPCAPETFYSSKLDWNDKDRNVSMYQLHRDLIRLRREDPVLSSWTEEGFDGAVLSPHAFVMRVFREKSDRELPSPNRREDRLLVVNLGPDLRLNPAPEPLLAPPDECEWSVMFSTESPAYGGCGTAPPDSDDNWYIPGHTALVLRAQPKTLPVGGRA